MLTRILCITLTAAALLAAQGPFAGKKKSAPPSDMPAHTNVDKLKSDLSAIQGKSQVTPAMKQQLANDLMAMCDGATKPSQASVQKLANDLADAIADKKISPAEMAKLTADLNKVLNSAGISMDEFNAVVSDAKAILTASGVTKSDVQLIVSDLQAIGAELKKYAPSSSKNAAAPAPAAKRFPRK